jgi:5-methylcytosine-specific restriction endonuclease McrA
MTMRPCLDCGEPSDGPRCPEHTTDPKTSAAHRGYDAAWTKLSKRARRLQPFCSGCGATDDLQTDHTPEAWARKAAGLTIRLQDVQVLCGPCNRAAGAARGSSATRGMPPGGIATDPAPRQSFPLSSQVAL